MYIPKYVFFTKGIGMHKYELQSFELALRAAKISQYNLVAVSSILPPFCKEISMEEGVKMLKPGQLVYLVLARNCTNEKNRLVSASIGVAKPKDNSQYGYLSEHHGFGEDEHNTGELAEDLAASMLASTLGIDFDIDSNYDEKRQIFTISDKIIETKSITASIANPHEHTYATVIAAAVFIMDSQ